MIVCICQSINEKRLLELAASHDHSLSKLLKNTNIGKDCGSCLSHVKDVVQKRCPSGDSGGEQSSHKTSSRR